MTYIPLFLLWLRANLLYLLPHLCRLRDISPLRRLIGHGTPPLFSVPLKLHPILFLKTLSMLLFQPCWTLEGMLWMLLNLCTKLQLFVVS
ncbi:ORF403 [White spot syndrome virus]|uniref:ORF403 n=1 Tax=White spot syndrome virus TaxID=342409 RepID=A0A2D3I5R2_9VIRU|nr:ORF403 [White spot syndrome virus]